MAYSVESPAVDVFYLPPPFLTNSTVVPLSASYRSFVLSGGCVGGDRGIREGENIRRPPPRAKLPELADTLVSNSSLSAFLLRGFGWLGTEHGVVPVRFTEQHHF